jgi:hypothetical protein
MTIPLQDFIATQTRLKEVRYENLRRRNEGRMIMLLHNVWIQSQPTDVVK